MTQSGSRSKPGGRVLAEACSGFPRQTTSPRRRATHRGPARLRGPSRVPNTRSRGQERLGRATTAPLWRASSAIGAFRGPTHSGDHAKCPSHFAPILPDCVGQVNPRYLLKIDLLCFGGQPDQSRLSRSWRPSTIHPWLPGRLEERTFHLLSGADRSCAPYTGPRAGWPQYTRPEDAAQPRGGEEAANVAVVSGSLGRPVSEFGRSVGGRGPREQAIANEGAGVASLRAAGECRGAAEGARRVIDGGQRGAVRTPGRVEAGFISPGRSSIDPGRAGTVTSSMRRSSTRSEARRC